MFAEVLHVNTEDVCRGHARAVRVVVGVHEVSECEAVAAGALRVEIQRIEQCGGVRVIPTGTEVKALVNIDALLNRCSNRRVTES